MSTKHTKGFIEARSKVDREREYEPAEAVQLVKELGRAKFDESVEVHIRTGLNVRHADEQLRGTIALPNGLGKEVKIIVFAQGDKAREAEEAGADVVGAEDLAKRVEEGFDDFDVAIATPDLMPVVGRQGQVPAFDHAGIHPGSRRQGRPHPSSRHPGGNAGRGVTPQESRHRRPPAARDGGWKTGRGGS